MKKISLILSFILLTLLSVAQVSLPDSIANKPVTIVLAGKYHGIIYELIPNRDETDAINYVIQVRQSMTSLADTSKNITVTVPYKLVANVYYIMGSQQERLTAADNREIESALLPQLYQTQYAGLLRIIGEIKAMNKEQTEAIRQSGINRIMAINL